MSLWHMPPCTVRVPIRSFSHDFQVVLCDISESEGVNCEDSVDVEVVKTCDFEPRKNSSRGIWVPDFGRLSYDAALFSKRSGIISDSDVDDYDSPETWRKITSRHDEVGIMESALSIYILGMIDSMRSFDCKLPPLIAVGADLADGHHRLHAALICNHPTIPAVYIRRTHAP